MDDQNLVCLTSLLKQTKQRASDLEWDGGNTSPLWDYAKTLQQKVDLGLLGAA